MQIRVDSECSLRRVADHCHGALLNVDRARYETGSQKFSLTLVRQMREKLEWERAFLFLQRWRVPKVESELVFHHVEHVACDWRDVQDVLDDISYDASRPAVVLQGAAGTRISLAVKELSGHLGDIGTEYFDGTTFTSIGCTHPKAVLRCQPAGRSER